MSHHRVIVTLRNTLELPENAITNTLYFDHTVPVALDRQQITDDIAALYQKARDGGFPSTQALFPPGWQINVRFYDMEDATPRPIKAEKTIPQGNIQATGPREVALCLSYYAERNLPRTRGRIFLGPFRGFSTQADKPADGLLQSAIDLGKGLGDIGGVDVNWMVHSVKNNDYHHIKNIWVDDSWDTMRSRGIDATKRSTASV